MFRTKTIYLTLPVLMMSVALFCGKKEETDLKKFTAMCERAAQCDQQVKAQGPKGIEICEKSMGLLEKKYPAKVPDMQTCVMNTKCEELSIGNCMAEMAKGLTNP